MIADAVKAVIDAAKEVADPYAWANRFSESRRKHMRDVELTKLAEDCKELNTALYDLEINPSYFLYDIVPGKMLDQLTDEELEDSANLEKVVHETKKFLEDFDRVVLALTPVEQRAYQKMGEVVTQLRKDLEARRRLLAELVSLIDEPRRPEEIRLIGSAYSSLIADIQPLREAIRSFVNEPR